MLIKVSCNNITYFINNSIKYNQEDEEPCLSLLISSGAQYWQIMSATCSLIRPPGRSMEPALNYFKQLEKIFANKISLPYSCEFREHVDGLMFIIKEKIGTGGQQIVVFRCTLPKYDNHDNSGTALLLDEACDVISSQYQLIQSLSVECECRGKTITGLQSDLQATLQYKDELQDNLLQNVVLLLNSKKREISRLRAAIDEMQSSGIRFPTQEEDESAVAQGKSGKKRVVRKPAAPKKTTRQQVAPSIVNTSRSTSTSEIAQQANVLFSQSSDTLEAGVQLPQKQPAFLSSIELVSGADITDYLSQPAVVTSSSVSSSSSCHQAARQIVATSESSHWAKRRIRDDSESGGEDRSDNDYHNEFSRQQAVSTRSTRSGTKPILTTQVSDESTSHSSLKTSSSGSVSNANVCIDTGKASSASHQIVPKKKSKLMQRMLDSSDDEDNSANHLDSFLV